MVELASLVFLLITAPFWLPIALVLGAIALILSFFVITLIALF